MLLNAPARQDPNFSVCGKASKKISTLLYTYLILNLYILETDNMSSQRINQKKLFSRRAS